MKRSTFLAVSAAGVFLFILAAFTTVAQDENADAVAHPALPRSVALLDAGYFFKHYPQFKEALSEIKADVDLAEQEVKQKKEELKGMQEQLAIHIVGTTEHTTLEAKVNTFKAQTAADIQTQKTGFLRREARVYHDSFEAMSQEVEEYAKTRNIAVVFRVNDEPVNVAEPKEVLKRINNSVIWYDKERDITRTILQRLARKSKKSEQDTKEPATGYPQS